MIYNLRFLAYIVLALLISGCGGSPDSPEALPNGDPPAAPSYTYFREYLFVGTSGEGILVAPFSFYTRERPEEGFLRGARGWLARGETWDRFIDESRSMSSAGGVWRVVPIGDLRLAAGGPIELEALRFEQAERRLRLDLQAPTSGWNQGGQSRFRLVDGALSVGLEELDGTILEVLRVERTLPDEWPPGEDYDAIFLASGDSLQLYTARARGEAGAGDAFAWLRVNGREQGWNSAEIRWGEMRPYEEARRDIPRSWSLRVAPGELSGEVTAVGFDALLGPERAGRRAVEIRYTVEGVVEVQGATYPVHGMIRHTQQ